MPKFSASSEARLRTCDPRLQSLLQEVVLSFDCSILEGHRGREAQELAFSQGRSKLHWPDGKHNHLPSNAVDVAAFPIDFGDRERQTLLAGFILGVAKTRGISLRWGGDWNSNTQIKDNVFDDLVHFELI